MTTATVGIMLPRDLPAHQIVPFVQKAEQLGFDEVWVVEDCFFRGGFAQAAVSLASTQHIRVGIGILPAPVRNAAFTALEANTLAEIYPGRLILGIGHGMPEWMRQVGDKPASILTMLDEQLTALRTLLSGEKLEVDGRYVRINGAQLETPATIAPPVLAGVRGPKSLAVSGRSADGTILAEPVTPEYLVAALANIDAAGPHAVVTYNVAAVDDDASVARDRARPALDALGEPDWAPHIDPLPFAEEFAALRARSATRAEFVAALPDEWVDALALVGTPDRVRERIAELHASGATSVVFIPAGADPLAQLDSLARAL
ncbi:Flavin-dependent oxidoreductase, luciferase family (includes alkanesulfonate monooxygenase SsuD and methylene tetrahydromethanopterin reductase) [Agreia bicolorata]|uniref:Flavin-dependent oxidoreductase, luciferase family (Includes alkanesulfonate monooxygenase SsuD and methylene tetrahydromethanopterin reductase) n=1 Tax=Agreia bicolorata TaxID=110935 RepID=A0A1T4XXG1_9MICO|nr:LLM class flavin-dependent oxidoreductase [Agreia bicolorata]SKA94204.1 Flavin-dependent oxidoreductase, luciferase family (includes alkanesulfonate monooxygenase SsuD and methylene tetrahydromethanopterin reductase) [Agreia bicolorata]